MLVPPDSICRSDKCEPTYFGPHRSYKKLLEYYNNQKKEVETNAARFLYFYVVFLLREIVDELITIAKKREITEGYTEHKPPLYIQVGNDDAEELFGPEGLRETNP